MAPHPLIKVDKLSTTIDLGSEQAHSGYGNSVCQAPATTVLQWSQFHIKSVGSQQGSLPGSRPSSQIRNCQVRLSHQPTKTEINLMELLAPHSCVRLLVTFLFARPVSRAAELKATVQIMTSISTKWAYGFLILPSMISLGGWATHKAATPPPLRSVQSARCVTLTAVSVWHALSPKYLPAYPFFRRIDPADIQV